MAATGKDELVLEDVAEEPATDSEVTFQFAAERTLPNGRRYSMLRLVQMTLKGSVLATHAGGFARGCRITVPAKGLSEVRVAAPK